MALDKVCQAAFEQLKSSLHEYSLLYHYVIGQDTELVVDASETGLGAVLVQRASKTEPFRPVMYKSRSLKDEETWYSATEQDIGNSLGSKEAPTLFTWCTCISYHY